MPQNQSNKPNESRLWMHMEHLYKRWKFLERQAHVTKDKHDRAAAWNAKVDYEQARDYILEPH